MKNMLVLEGFFYARGAPAVTGTVGTAVTYILYQSMNYRDIPFQIPLLPVLGVSAAILLICSIIPVISYGKLAKRGSVVERIRGFE